MRLTRELSRRDAIVAGGCGLVSVAALATAPLGRSLLADNGRTISMVTASDPTFVSKIDSLFPGLREDLNFQITAPSAALITNASRPAILALSFLWSVTSTAGVQQTELSFYSRASHKSFLTVRHPLLPGGNTLLVSPFFKWTSKGYAAKKPDWNRLFGRGGLTSFLLQEIPNAKSVEVELSGALYEDWTVTGRTGAVLGQRIAAMRNGEHDEGFSILEAIKADASTQNITGTLEKHSTIEGLTKDGLSVPRSQAHRFWYYTARARKARILLHSFRTESWSSFIRHLTVLRNTPKTQISLP